MFMQRILLVTLLFATVSCAKDNKADNNWYSSMQELSSLLSEVMPSLALNRYEDTEKGRQDIKALANKLSGLSHGIDKATVIPSKDPSLRFVTREFKSELQAVQALIDEGKWHDVGPRLYKTTQYCVACHTRVSGGSSEYSLNLNPNLNGFSNYDKAVYYSAVRQFESAIVHYEYALTDLNWAKENPDRWNKGIVSLLSIVARVKRDPNLVLEMLSRFFDSGTYPAQLKDNARIWRAQVVRWEKEKTEQPNLARVKRWMNESKTKYKSDLRALILHLRASADLNELLRVGTLQGENEQLALLYSGQISEAHPDLNLGGFPRDYYLACFDVGPKTATGRACGKKVAP